MKIKEDAKKQFDEKPRIKIKIGEEKSRHELEEKIEKKFQEVKLQIDENNSYLSALYAAGAFIATSLIILL